jgi:uncharacterized protein YecE (DUF72 family)
MVYTDIPHESRSVYIGTAGWAIRREHTHLFADVGTHLQRYATLFNCVEINSCFYRPHRFSTYERWAGSVPDHFRFAVKLPKVITHELRFVGIDEALDRFLEETSGLGAKLGPILVQLPPSFAFEESLAADFFATLRGRFTGQVVFEPRHETWFTPEAESLLITNRIARVAADPARVPQAAEPAGFRDLVYYRLHGSPRIYYSAYTPEYLHEVSRRLGEHATSGVSTWCIFDNTALGAATSDALSVKSNLLESQQAAR